MIRFAEKIKDFFTKQPLPNTGFQLTSHYITGIHISKKDKRIVNKFIYPLEKGVVLPSFDKKNIKDPDYLEKIIKNGMKNFRFYDRSIACFIPEVSLKTFVFSFDSLPASKNERMQVIRFRIKKKMPMLPEDVELSYDTLTGRNSETIVATMVRNKLIQEYEEFFDRFNLKLKTIGVPSFCLYNLISEEEDKNTILINIEEDMLSMIGIIDSRIVLYRLKPYLIESLSELSVRERIQSILKEIENTVNFIEDKEKKKVDLLRIRWGLFQYDEAVISSVEEKLAFPVKKIGESINSHIDFKEKEIFSPLIGQLLV